MDDAFIQLKRESQALTEQVAELLRCFDTTNAKAGDYLSRLHIDPLPDPEWLTESE